MKIATIIELIDNLNEINRDDEDYTDDINLIISNTIAVLEAELENPDND